jgi:23S rRNA pseudouridine2605 synthase
MTLRLQKALSHAGVASRREAERMIAEGRVLVNGELVTTPGTRVETADRIQVDGRPVRTAAPFTYLLMNKPRGCVTTLSDPQGRSTVADLLPRSSTKVFPVGRLDYGSEGLLLFTNDGELAQRLMRPSGSVVKTYEAKVRGLPEAAVLERLQRPFRIEGRPTRPARVRLLAARRNALLSVSLTEGRRNQVREMLLRVGHPVMRLRRVAYGPLRDARLRPGDVRALTTAEIAALRAVAAPVPARRSSRNRVA